MHEYECLLRALIRPSKVQLIQHLCASIENHKAVSHRVVWNLRQVMKTGEQIMVLFHKYPTFMAVRNWSFDFPNDFSHSVNVLLFETQIQAKFNPMSGQLQY